MAKGSSFGMGGVAGVALAVVLVGAIVGAPFYVAHLRSETRALDTAVRDDIETIRRCVLHIDENLSALGDIRDVAGDDALVDAELAEELEKAHPNIYSAATRDLEVVTNALRNTRREDERRGITADARPPGGGRPSGGRVVGDMQNKILPATERMLGEARKAANRLRTLSVGGARATSHLGVNRILAVYELAEGRIHANRAALQRQQAAARQTEAADRLGGIAAARRAAARLEGENPDAMLEVIRDGIVRTDAALARMDEALGGLQQLIQAKTTRLAGKTRQVAEARAELVELDPTGRVVERAIRAMSQFEVYRSEYVKHSDALRSAAAEAAALQHGTLAGAVLSEEADDNLLTGSYNGGRVEVGLVDLKAKLGTLERARDAYAQIRKDLATEQTELESRQEDLRSGRSELTAAVTLRTEEVDALLAVADGFHERATTAEEAAMKSFKAAAGNVTAALRAATARNRSAREAAADSSGSNVEHPSKRIADDKEVEAGLHVLAGEIAYNTALLRLDQINARRGRFGVVLAIAAAAGRTAPGDINDEIDGLRTEAREALAQAIEQHYAKAANLIKASQVRTPHGSLSGANYVWQVQVGQAALHLLDAQLAEDPATARASRASAYDLLTQAVQGREQSPLLATALDTHRYLQETAR